MLLPLPWVTVSSLIVPHKEGLSCHSLVRVAAFLVSQHFWFGPSRSSADCLVGGGWEYLSVTLFGSFALPGEEKEVRD